jgi:asparagine synthase (glutamine-hydrolysing)
MCGISGWVSFRQDLTRQQDIIERMTATMSRRGPDAKGTWVREHVALGHHRLAVIDLLGGTQPMTADTPGGDVAISYSGEVYNFADLRGELRRRGHAFKTESDTEVVLRGYLEWGDAVVDRINGMYALALWDARAERLLLIRDRMGIKPLYYYPTEDGVLFGSEPKAILANPLAEAAVDAEGLRELFGGFIKTPGHAIWAGMHEVRPGHLIILDRDGLRDRTYWQLEARPHDDDLTTTIETVRDLLQDSVARQLVADVPRCVLLSGGLDSSTVTGLASRHLASEGGELRTFAVDFIGQEENFKPDLAHPTTDAPFVRAVAEHVGCQHEDIVLDHTEVSDPEIRQACVAARDLPLGFGDREQSAYLLFRAIRERSTVALSGESGDEIFGGYPSFHIPTAVNSGTFPWLALAPIKPTTLLDAAFLADIDHAGFLKSRYADAVTETPVLEGEEVEERRMRIICYLHLTRLLPVMLDRKDRLSMAVGLEARVPVCDYRLVEYVYNVPWAMKSFDGHEKSLLRAAAADVLPRSVFERRKSGYPATHDPRYMIDIQRQAADLLASGHAALDFYDRRQVTEAVHAEPASLDPGTRSGLERLLDLSLWMDTYRPTLATR